MTACANERAGRLASPAASGIPLSVGIAYRSEIAEWTRANLHQFDVLEITVDHCLHGNETVHATIFDLVGRVPLTAHGVGLSIGTDMPLDLAYLDRVAGIVERLKAPAYSEHLAFTRAPSYDLANLLPLPKTEEVAESVIGKVRTVQSRISAPFLLENISYVFEWPDSKLSDAEFLNLICGETGAGLLLDIENVYLNSRNHCFDPIEFIDALAPGLVQEVHMAGGIEPLQVSSERTFVPDTHSHPVADAVLDLLEYALSRHSPRTIIVERDERLDEVDEIMDDVARIRARLNAQRKTAHATTALRPAD